MKAQPQTWLRLHETKLEKSLSAAQESTTLAAHSKFVAIMQQLRTIANFLDCPTYPGVR
jgi:hypothetical protein